jgi:hypothetical protein
MSAKNSGGYRRVYRDVSTSGVVGSAGTGVDNAIAVPSTKHTIFVQKIHVDIQTDGQVITFKDDAGTPVVIATIAADVTGPVTIDFGDRGFALTEGKNLDISNTATPVYSYTVDAYARQTSAVAASSIVDTLDNR